MLLWDQAVSVVKKRAQGGGRTYQLYVELLRLFQAFFKHLLH